MISKLKRRVNKLYGMGVWQKLAASDKKDLLFLGAHDIWKIWRHMIRTVDELINAAKLAALNAENLKIAKETEPWIFKTGTPPMPADNVDLSGYIIGVDLAKEGSCVTVIHEEK